MIKFLLVAVVGLSIALFAAMKKHVVLEHEIEFLELSYKVVQENMDDVKQRYLLEYTQAKLLRQKVEQYKREIAHEKALRRAACPNVPMEHNKPSRTENS